MQLIVFANEVDMHAIALEGLIAYRIDVKQLFYRDNVTWRPIRVSQNTYLATYPTYPSTVCSSRKFNEMKNMYL